MFDTVETNRTVLNFVRNGNNLKQCYFGELYGSERGSVLEVVCSLLSSFSALDLPDRDASSKSDPFVIVYIRNIGRPGIETDWVEVYQTNTIPNNSNPVWPLPGVVEYNFEIRQRLRFDVHDRDLNNVDPNNFIGSFEIPFPALLAAEASTVSGGLVNRVGRELKRAKIIVTGEQQGNFNAILEFPVRGLKLARRANSGFRSGNPFFIIRSQLPSGILLIVFRSRTQNHTNNPFWGNNNISILNLNNADYARKLNFEFYDRQSSGNHYFIGSFETSLDEILVTSEYPILNPAKERSRSGTCIFENIQIVERENTFLEYIQGGCQLNFVFAIDFTASNGDPTDESSLHFIPRNFVYKGGLEQIGEMNDYQVFLVSIGQVIQDFDKDKMFAAYGFGANLDPRPLDPHCFPLTLNPKVEEVEGIEGAMRAYQHALKQINFSEPIRLAPVINKVTKRTPDVTQEKQSYSTFLIITVGVATDLHETIDAIIEASRKAISIIIIGLGAADFGPMEVLNEDGKLLGQNGKTVERDMVQFLSYEEHKAEGFHSLVEESLKHIPYQMEEFFKLKGIKPNSKPPIDPKHYKPLPMLAEGNNDMV